MALALPKIIYPSAPPLPAAPGCAAGAGGALPAGNYDVVISYNSNDGEGLPSPVTTVNGVALNGSITVTAPTNPSAATQPINYYVYIRTSGIGNYFRATVTGGQPVPFTTNAVITANSGATNPQSSFGTTLSFLQPARKVPATIIKETRYDNISYAGFRQTIDMRQDTFLEFEMEKLAIGTDVNAWVAFLQTAMRGKPFDYYPDSTLGAFTTYHMDGPDANLAFKSLGQFTSPFRFRKEIF